MFFVNNINNNKKNSNIFKKKSQKFAKPKNKIKYFQQQQKHSYFQQQKKRLNIFKNIYIMGKRMFLNIKIFPKKNNPKYKTKQKLKNILQILKRNRNKISQIFQNFFF